MFMQKCIVCILLCVYFILTKNIHNEKFFYIFRILDISFNRITKIENLDNLTNLKRLFLINNKITKIENVGHLENLELLELGSNRIRVS